MALGRHRFLFTRSGNTERTYPLLFHRLASWTPDRPETTRRQDPRRDRRPQCPRPRTRPARRPPPRAFAGRVVCQPVGGVRWLLRFRITGFASWHFRWCRREHRGARPQEMDRSRSATARAGAAMAVTATPTEPSLADQIARPRAVAIDPAAGGPSGRAGAQRRPSTWFSRPHKNVRPTEPTLSEGPDGMVRGLEIRLPADPPCRHPWAGIRFASPHGAEGLGRSAGHPADETGSPASQEAGSGNH